MAYCAAAGLVSIDLGTSFIKVAGLNSSSSSVITDIVGGRGILNVIYFTPERQLVGKLARKEIRYNWSSVFVGITQLLGLSMNTNILDEYQECGHYYTFLPTERDTLKLKISSNEGESSEMYATIEELSALIFRYINSLVVEHFGTSNHKYVVTVPASFTLTQRQAVIESAKLADIQMDAIIDQTTAAAIAYVSEFEEQLVEYKRVVLMDVGATYTQFTVFEVVVPEFGRDSPNGLRILGKNVVRIGRTNFAMAIASMIVNYITALGYSDYLNNSSNVAEIRKKSKICLKEISMYMKVTVEKLSFIDRPYEDLTITRDTFDSQVNHLLSKLYEAFQMLLFQSNLGLVGRVLIRFPNRMILKRYR